ncbi:MAG TPA: family 20 glycosylhydrolase, partial [Armatimonadota bacterium]|nr:family 20 glycosylhydrolase [Armatimonadota bacterium]
SRIERFLNSKGKTIIGWAEILEGGLAPNAAVMSWRGMSGGIAAAKAGHDVVMTPTSHCYLDYYQAKGNEPKAIGGFLPIETVYSLEPVPEELTEDQKKHILGVQGNLWSEYIPNLSHLEYMAYPRACALSEVAWTPAEKRDWNDFESRLIHHLTRLSERGVNYRPLSVGEK